MTVHLLIKGRVQGVFFRATAKEIADKLGVKGWIKNTDNDEVEAVISGNDKAVKDFIEWCKTGPRKAEVAEVILENTDEKNFDDFVVIRE